MKKLIFTLFFFSAALFASAQTYYWVGVPGTTWGSANAWSLTSGGPAIARDVTTTDDILIFDLNSGVVNVQPTSETIRRLQLLAGADVSLNRTSATGTSTVTITEAMSIEAAASLTLTGAGTVSTVLILNGTTTPLLNSQITGQLLLTGAGASKVAVQGQHLLFFNAGSTCLAASATNPFSTTTSGTPSVDRSVRFLAGSTFKFRTASNPFGATATNIAVFESLSNFRFEAPILGSFFGSTAVPRLFGNIIVANNQLGGTSVPQTITFNSSPFYLDSVIAESGNTLNFRESGVTPIAGSIVAQPGATIGVNTPIGTSNILLFGGTSQSIGGGGGITLSSLSVGTNSTVAFKSNFNTIGTSSGTNSGRINAGTFSLLGTSPFQFRTGGQGETSGATFTQGGNTVVLDPLFFSSSVNTANVAIGYLISGAGIPANTYIIGTSTATSTVTISKPTTATFPANSGSVTVFGGAGTLQTSNPGGVDGSIATTGSRTFGTGTNYIFDAQTSTPFNVNTNTTGNVTFNAAATTNKTALRIGGVLALNSGKLTIRAADSVIVNSAGSVTGTNATNYIVTASDGTATGVFMRNGFLAPTLFPVGTPTRYMPVTLAPQTTAADFAVSVFEGITDNGTPGGTPFTPTQKADVVDAIWTINRPLGSASVDPCTVTINWTGDLEGSNFAALSNNQIGITRYNGTSYDPAIANAGTGDNAANTVSATFTNFSPFGVGQLTGVVPVNFVSVNASGNASKINVTWKVAQDINIERYEVEKAGSNGQFISAGSENSRQLSGASEYIFTDLHPYNGVNLYRIRAVGINGEVILSAVAKVVTNGKSNFSILQNPVQNSRMQVSLAELKAGKYSLILTNNAGQKVFEQAVIYSGGTLSNTVQLPASVRAGFYRLSLRGEGEVKTINVVVE